MSNISCEHNSHNFRLNLDHTPSKATDRFSRVILITGFAFGLLLCLLGVFYFIPDLLTGRAEIENGIPKTKVVVETLFAPEVFHIIIILTGLILMTLSTVNFMRYKKIFFDGSSFVVLNRPFGRDKQTFTEPLYNYLGVRLRVVFYQFGIINKNKFIIELYHRDHTKIVPLYISTKQKNIRQIWKDYAQKLHMPAITISEKGMVSHNFKDLDLPYQEVVAKWHLPRDFERRIEKPSYISFKSRSSGEKLLSIRKIFLDAYSILNILFISVLSALLTFALLNHQVIMLHLTWLQTLSFYAFLVIVIAYAVLNLTVKDLILVAQKNICIYRQILFFRVCGGIIPIASIKGIDINFMPTAGRYYLSIITDKENYIVGSKIPVSDLRWIRAILIREIIGN